MIARWTNYCRGVPRQQHITRSNDTPKTLPKPFSQDWEREWRNLFADGHRLPYALLMGFWDARTLRRVVR